MIRWLSRLLGHEASPSHVQDALDTVQRSDDAMNEVQAAVDGYWLAKRDAAILAAYQAEQARVPPRPSGRMTTRSPM